MGYIYKITNSLNQKCYIGQTTKKPHVRVKEHCGNSSNSLLSKTIREVGKYYFDYEVLEAHVPREELDLKEVFYIYKYNSVWPNGYNVNPGNVKSAAEYFGAKEELNKQAVLLANNLMGQGIDFEAIVKKFRKDFNIDLLSLGIDKYMK